MNCIDLTLELNDGLSAINGYHCGTHVDAPSHVVPGGASVEQVDINKLLGTAIMLDVTDSKEANQPVTRAMLEEAEKAQGVYIEERDIVLVRMWKGQWGEEGFFNCLSFAEDAAKWLAEKNIHAVGIDLPSVDDPRNEKREIHAELLQKNIYIIENLINLDKVPKHSRFIFSGMPLKLRNATASPVRALAILDAQFIDY